MRDMTIDRVEDMGQAPEAAAPGVSPRYRIQAIERAVAILEAWNRNACTTTNGIARTKNLTGVSSAK